MVKHNPPQTQSKIIIEENTDKGTRKVHIVIADNGLKIAAELQGCLFESFTVGDESRNTKNGSGLGLTISKRIIERHGGLISYVNDMEDGYKGFVIEFE